MTISLSVLAQQDHKAGVKKSAVAIANAQGGNYFMLTEPEQLALIDGYETAWAKADTKAAA